MSLHHPQKSQQPWDDHKPTSASHSNRSGERKPLPLLPPPHLRPGSPQLLDPEEELAVLSLIPNALGCRERRRPIASTFFRRAASSCLSICALTCTTARRVIQCFHTMLSGGKGEGDPRTVTTELAELISSTRGSVEDLLSESGICTPRSGSSPDPPEYLPPSIARWKKVFGEELAQEIAPHMFVDVGMQVTPWNVNLRQEPLAGQDCFTSPATLQHSRASPT